jgi:hypothetical protein
MSLPFLGLGQAVIVTVEPSGELQDKATEATATDPQWECSSHASRGGKVSQIVPRDAHLRLRELMRMEIESRPALEPSAVARYYTLGGGVPSLLRSEAKSREDVAGRWSDEVKPPGRGPAWTSPIGQCPGTPLWRRRHGPIGATSSPH